MSNNNIETKFQKSAPYFPVTDPENSVRFFEKTLGFRCEYSAGTPVQFAICSRDGLEIMFRRVADPKLIVPNEKQGGTWDVFFWVSGISALHLELKSKGAEIVYGPVDQDYGIREFAVRDCDGHVLGFGEAIK